ncbi:hypothetical protein OMDBNIEC_00037 [Salmonella phage STP-SP5]|nr:hypothetical protein OMDBNIEC_00037 [Salmonella phage STP-SP5]
MFDANKATQATEADVIEWYNTKAQLQKIQAKERLLREKIIKSYFPAPTEGTNKVEITGAVMKMTHKIDRKIDLPSLNGILGDLIKVGVDVDQIVENKPTLKVANWRKLNAEQAAIFNQCVESKVGSASLEIVPNK